MRAGGGCQFTFTCDGSLARAAGAGIWARARQIAAEALAGRTFAARRPVDLLPRQLRLPVLGAAAGQDGGDRRAHLLPPARPRRRARRVQRRLCRQRAGVRGSSYMARASRGGGPGRVVRRRAGRRRARAAIRAAAPVPSDIPQDARWAASNLPASDDPRGISPVRPVARPTPRPRSPAAASRSGSAAPPASPGPACRASPSISLRLTGASAMCRSVSAIGDRPPRPRREGALIGGRAVAVQAGMGRRRAARQRHRDAVAGEAGDHRRLVAEPEQARARSRARASHKARRRSPPMRRAPRRRAARRAAAPPASARRAAPRGPPAMRACATERQRLAAPSSCSSSPA